MRHLLHIATLSTLTAVLLGACTSPPRPSAADEATRRPANPPGSVDLQACKVDLHNTRLLASEAARAAEAAAAMAKQLAQQHQALLGQATNMIVDVAFTPNSSKIALPDAVQAALVERARQAPRLVIHAEAADSTDKNQKLARTRVAAVRSLLVQSGVRPEVIRGSWSQPDGNATSTGRVEIELYVTAPRALADGTSVSSTR